MHRIILLALIPVISYTAQANMPESDCYDLQAKAYKHADSENPDPKRQLELSMQLTEECGYLMNEATLKQRRSYNYKLYKSLYIDSKD